MTYHTPTEEENLSFQQGRAVAQYLENMPCRKGVAVCHIVCPDCIAEAVNIVHEAHVRAANVEREKRPRIVPKVYGDGRPKPEVKGNGRDPLAFHFALEAFQNEMGKTPCECIMECFEADNCRHFFKNPTPSV